MDNASSSKVVNPDEDCKDFLFVIYVVVFGVMGVVGLVGNSVSFMVLRWEKRNRTATFLLQALCMTDSLFLLINVFVQMFSGLGLYLEWTVYEHTLPYIMVYIWPFIHITQFATVWMTVLVAANRYIAICMPFKAHKLCTINKIRIQVIVVSLFAVIYNIPRFVEYQVHYRMLQHFDGNVTVNETYAEGRPSDMKDDQIYQIIYENVLYCLFVFLGPLVILVILNARLIRELVKARQRLVKRHIPIPGEEEEQNLTLVMVVIVLIFVICQTPAFINALLNVLLGDGAYACGRAYYYFYHLSNVLVSANSSTNFFVYFVFRKSFRERLRAFCSQKRTPMIQTHTESTPVQGRTLSVYSANGLRNGDAL